MKNPWQKLNPSPFENENIYCPGDEGFIKKFLEENSELITADTALKLNIIPQHYIGNILKSKILILSLNPGYNEEYQSNYNDDKNFQTSIKNNLLLNSYTKFYALDIEKRNKVLGYWGKKLNLFFNSNCSEQNIVSKFYTSLDPTFNNSFQNILDQNFSIIDFFPYHSKKYFDKYDKIGLDKKGRPDYLPSQKFVFGIIKQRIVQGDVKIIIMRSKTKWLKAIKELEYYDNTFVCSNYQNPSLNSIYKLVELKKNSEKVFCDMSLDGQLK